MTPEQTEELAALKAALKQHIEEAENATPGPWTTYENKQLDKLSSRRIGVTATNNDTAFTNTVGLEILQCKNNAVFIAHARTMSPLACRIALAGIEALENRININRFSDTGFAALELRSILNLWKGGEA